MENFNKQNESAELDVNVESESEKSLMAKSVGLEVRVSMIGTTRKVSTTQIDTGSVDETLLRLSKVILDSKELERIRSLRGELGRRLETRALPCSMFKSGVKLVAIASIPDVQAIVEDYERQFNEAVEAFIDAYPRLKEEAKERLGPMYDESDYPSIDKLRQTFGFWFRYFSFNTPDALKSISQELFSEEQKKAAEKWDEAADEIRDALREGFSGLVDHFVDVLTPDEDGKRKKLFESFTDKFGDFLDAFEGRNVTNDAELGTLVAKAKGVVQGVPLDRLRKDESVRDRILAGLEDVQKSSKGLTTKSVRKVNVRRQSDSVAA